MSKILAAMSGGVDSAACALLLLREGYDVAGGSMYLRPGSESECNDARNACFQIGIPFYQFYYPSAFERLVVEPFQAAYQAGLTPNPCIVCNQTMKFGRLLSAALACGFDRMATGHYARLETQGDRTLLKTALDESRDQSYFLYTLSQEQLAHLVFPLGSYTKAEARALTEQAGLALSSKHDSQDICFVPDGDYMAYLCGRGMLPHPGHFIRDGQIVAAHSGMEAYTIGQRRGLGYAAGERIYVTGKRNGDVFLGENAALFSQTVVIEQVNYIAFSAPKRPFEAECKLRSGPRRALCTVTPTETGAVLTFREPQRAVTPGQSAVFYEGDTVLGGGIITDASN